MILTKKQREIMKTLWDEPVGTTMQLEPYERRTAESLSRRGLIKIVPGESFLGHFEIVAVVHPS